jgi:hypothetical protein
MSQVRAVHRMLDNKSMYSSVVQLCCLGPTGGQTFFATVVVFV